MVNDSVDYEKAFDKVGLYATYKCHTCIRIIQITVGFISNNVALF